MHSLYYLSPPARLLIWEKEDEIVQLMVVCAGRLSTAFLDSNVSNAIPYKKRKRITVTGTWAPTC